jgi:hypothetical protein
LAIDIILFTLNYYFMQKSSIRKYSILGLVLITASAVTAAILPSKSNSDSKDKNLLNGRLTASAGAVSQQTCVPDGAVCDVTESGTSANQGGGQTSTHGSTTGGGHTSAN